MGVETCHLQMGLRSFTSMVCLQYRALPRVAARQRWRPIMDEIMSRDRLCRQSLDLASSPIRVQTPRPSGRLQYG
jgi:hypothetical protein